MRDKKWTGIGEYAGPGYLGEAIHVKRHKNYSGGPDGSFGNASEWPFVTVEMAFREKDFGAATQFAKDAMEFCRKWRRENLKYR